MDIESEAGNAFDEPEMTADKMHVFAYYTCRQMFPGYAM